MSSMITDLVKELERFSARGERRRLFEVEERRGPRIRVKGRWYLNLSSNDYLGLAAQVPWGELWRETEALGFGSGASRLMSGNHRLYVHLEEKLASLFGRPALVFSSGFLANLGIISSLVGRRDAIFADKLVHASLIDGMRLSGAEFFRYPHQDPETLARLLSQKRSHYRRALIITESVFSMDGDLTDLRTLVELKKSYEALLLVDEAHAIGVFGQQGLGLSEELGLLSEIDILIGTFGKALGSYGAFVITSKELREYLIHRARSFIFTTALPTVVVAASLWGLSKAVFMKNERKHLKGLSRRLREELKKGPFTVLGDADSGSPIVPVVVGENEMALALAERLKTLGYWVTPVRPPTVPRGTARLRLSLSSEMTWEDLIPLANHLTGSGLDQI